MRRDWVEEILVSDYEEREQKLHELIKGKETLNINIEESNNSTTGEKLSDKMAAFTGSWNFLIYFSIIVSLYMLLNVVELIHTFDPYPFVFLNLILACLSSVQAPMIMMSQNREAKKDRLRAENEYLINLKSEIILEDLHMKIDELLNNQRNFKKQLETINNRIDNTNLINLGEENYEKEYTNREKH